jgi:hypothetical protein
MVTKNTTYHNEHKELMFFNRISYSGKALVYFVYPS